MRETLKMMRTVVKGYEKTRTIDDLLQEYKTTQCPNVLAYLYVNNYGLIEKAASYYYLLDTQDIASYSLQELDKAIMQFDFNSNCKFITFFVSCLNNRLRHEQQLLMCNNRKANYFSEDIDLVNIINYNDFNKLDLPKELSKNELIQAKLLLSGYKSSEIANALNISRTAVYKRSKKIAEKIKFNCF